jgi:hypothetical protein
MNLSNKAIEVIGMSVVAVGATSGVLLALLLIRVAGGCIEKGMCVGL